MTLDELINDLIHLRDVSKVPGNGRVWYGARVMGGDRPSVVRQDIRVGVADFGREVMLSNAWDEWVLGVGSKLAARLRENDLPDD